MHSDAAVMRAIGIDDDALEALIRGTCGDPFSLLGAHASGDGWVVRSFVPGAEAATLECADGRSVAMIRLHDGGVFAARLETRPGRYRIAARNAQAQWSLVDAYQFGPLLGELDDQRIADGSDLQLWRTLGARPVIHEGSAGAAFAVWAPASPRVSVMGDFNLWDGRRHPMRRRDASGVWELFIPGLAAGERYKYEVMPAGGGLPAAKTDPLGFQAERRPENCSILCDIDTHVWRDAEWMAGRAARQRSDSPISIYEVHLGSWRRHDDGSWLTYRELAETLVPYVRDLGFTHIEVLPLAEHPLDGSWGYQPVGLFAPTSRFGDLSQFRQFVEACHAADLGLILDWVPAHFPVDRHGLAQFDGSALYEYADPREGFHPDWNTLIYNFARPEVGNFLLANALYWVRGHHADALRVDAVASMLYRDYNRKPGEWIANRHGGRENLEAIAFLQRLNSSLRDADPSLMTVAEESAAWPGVTHALQEGGLGFDFKWNMGWTHDTLSYLQTEPAARASAHGTISFCLHYAFDENFILSLSHDEVMPDKGSLWSRVPGTPDEKAANLRAYFAFMWAHPGKKLLFMGCEWGQGAHWDFDRQLDWPALADPVHAGLQTLVRDLNGVYRAIPALHRRDCRADGFQWLEGGDDQSCVFAWLRHAGDDLPPLLAVFNFSAVEQRARRLGVPHPGRWREQMNSDAAAYGGQDRGNLGGVIAEARPSHGQPCSVVLRLPPLSGLYFLWEGR